jgi:riboflavin biosynthesis pyrimidine reductase
VIVEQLLPPGAPIAIEQVLRGVHPRDDPAARRPHVIGSLISTVNGRATLDGRTAPLSPPGGGADREIFRGLRGVCDAIMVGTGTLRDELYGRPGRRRTLREFRASRGLPEEPKVIVVSRSLELPTHIPLFRDPATEVLLFTWSKAAIPEPGAQITTVRMDPDDVTLASVLRHARESHGIRSVVCEGGPTLYGALLTEDLIDELFLTIAPVYAGDDQLPLTTSGHAARATPMSLASVHTHDDYLFLRYIRRASADERPIADDARSQVAGTTSR